MYVPSFSQYIITMLYLAYRHTHRRKRQKYVVFDIMFICCSSVSVKCNGGSTNIS